MACTTILVGKKASCDGSTMIARNDDSPSGVFHIKKLVRVEGRDKPLLYQSVLTKFKIELPAGSLAYTAMPNANPKKEGVWAAAGMNEADVGMTATETITSNPRVLGADPYVKDGIGEEDLVAIVLPYIHSAREGVLRLGSLIEKYGTYEPNGIGFNDENEVWWLESIGGHHWMAKRVKDDSYVVMPNQLGIDCFDFEDAYGAKKEHLCAEDLLSWSKKNHLFLDQVDKSHLFLDQGEKVNPRLAYGSHDDSDHVYNTPRAWYMLRYFNPRSMHFDGPDAYHPEDDDLPWSALPEHKITLEEVKHALSSHYQGTPFDPYAPGAVQDGINHTPYRPIGVNRTAFYALLQVRGYAKEGAKSIEWFSFGSNVFNEQVPFFPFGKKVPSYYGNTKEGEVSTDSFYWANRLLGALADAHFSSTSLEIERYQNAVSEKAHEVVNEVDEGKIATLEEANQKMADEAKKLTNEALGKVLFVSTCHMKNAFSRSDR